MVTTPGVTYKMFRALAEDSINILAISTSEIKLSVIINEKDTLKAIEYYKKSLAINPENRNSLRNLTKLKKNTKK